MLKILCVIFCLALVSYVSNAQNPDPVRATDKEEKWKLIQTLQSDIFRFKDTTRWALRWNASSFASPQIHSQLSYSYLDFTLEFRALRNWSIGISSRFQSSFSNYSLYEANSGLKLGLEIRNYIRKADQGPNMNGLYWGLKAETGRNNILIDQSLKYLGNSVTGRMGFQALLTKTFFLDLSLGLGADYRVLDQYTSTSMEESPVIKVVANFGWKPLVDPQFKMGWSISRPRPTAVAKDLWLRGQSTKSTQYKIDLFGLFNHNLSGISTAIELEKAFGKSGFSINLGAAGELHRPNHITGADQDQLYVEKYSTQSWRAYVEPRWYYNIPKRLRKNLTIDVFSGNFISLLMGHQQIYYKSDFDNQPYVKLREQSSRSGAELCWGMQRSFFNVAFAECRFGVASMIEKDIYDDGAISHSIYAFDAVADVKIGLKF
jgi:hypothetical protein